MTADEALAAMTALVNQNIVLSQRLSQLQTELDAAKAPKEEVIGS